MVKGSYVKVGEGTNLYCVVCREGVLYVFADYAPQAVQAAWAQGLGVAATLPVA